MVVTYSGACEDVGRVVVAFVSGAEERTDWAPALVQWSESRRCQMSISGHGVRKLLLKSTLYG